VNIDESCGITVNTNPGNFLYFLIIYREKYPVALTPAQLNKKGRYEDYSDEEYQKIFAWDLSRYRNGTSYRIPLRFTKEGLYYILIYSNKTEITKPSSLDTKGKTPASGIVIRVRK
jgi:hypothetical protein